MALALTPIQRQILERLRALGPDGNPSSAKDNSGLARLLSSQLGVHPSDLLEPIQSLRERGLINVWYRTAYGYVSSISGVASSSSTSSPSAR